MPRPKPSFETFKHYFDGLNYIVANGNFNKNTKITITCPENHEYITSITKIESLKQDYKNCPHCKRDIEYNKSRVHVSFFDDMCKKYNLEILNKKEYYKRWDDIISFKCLCCNEHTFDIKSIFHLEKNINDKSIECPICKMKSMGILNKNEFDKKINELSYKPNTEQVQNVSLDVELPSALSNRFNTQTKWILLKYINTKTNAIFQCVDCGYKKECYPHNIVSEKGIGCVRCDHIKKSKQVHEKLRDICKISNCYPIVSENYYKNVNEFIEFKCNNCGSIFEKQWIRIHDIIQCPNCFKSTKRKSENSLYEFITEIYSESIEQNNRDIIPPYELDIYIPEKKLAIEFCGGIWHSEKYNDDINRHQRKYELCENKGIRLITIFEDEWVDNNEICKSRLKNLFNKIEKKIHARKCDVIEIPNDLALRFCEQNHIQGKGHTNLSYALLYDKEIVSVMTFSKPSISKNANGYDWELNRFCSLKDVVINGGANKLFNHFKHKNPGKEVITFCDLRWGSGRVYDLIGFNLVHTTRPNYYYIGNHTKWKRKHRFNFTKQRLIEIFKETDTTLTEHEIALKNELYRIYDCGHKKFTLRT